jgi:hypothetical protein
MTLVFEKKNAKIFSENKQESPKIKTSTPGLTVDLIMLKLHMWVVQTSVYVFSELWFSKWNTSLSFDLYALYLHMNVNACTCMYN